MSVEGGGGGGVTGYYRTQLSPKPPPPPVTYKCTSYPITLSLLIIYSHAHSVLTQYRTIGSCNSTGAFSQNGLGDS